MNTEEMQVEVLLDASISEVLPMLSNSTDGKKSLSLSRLIERRNPIRVIPTTIQVELDGYIIRELESGSIEVEYKGEKVSPVKPALRELATRLNVGLINSKGNALNTRQLGTQIIQSIQELTNNTQTKLVSDLDGE